MKPPCQPLGPRLTAAAALIVTTGSALAGCGSGGSGPAAVNASGSVASPAAGNPGNPATGSAARALASCSSYPGAKSCYFITVTAAGAQAFHGTDTLPNQEPCADVLAQRAKTNAGEVQLSVPVFLTGPVAAFDAYLDRYHGPGTYSTASNDASLTLIIGSVEYGSAGVVSAVAAADGSVLVRFSNLVSSAIPAQTISGQARFTCRNI